MVDIVFEPARFFERRRSDSSLRIAFAIVVLTGVLGTMRAGIVLEPVLSALPQGGGAVASIPLLITIAAPFAVAIGVWFLYTGAFHFLAILAFDEWGDVRQTLKLVGWGFVPRVFGRFVLLGVTVWDLRLVDSPQSTEGITPYLNAVAATQNQVLLQSTNAIFVAWSAVLWLLAIRTVYDVSGSKAAMVVGIPVALECAWLVYAMG